MNKINSILNELNKINKNIDIFIITNMSNIKYITGEEIEGYILLEKDKTYIVTDGRYIEVANNVCNELENASVIDILNKEEVENVLSEKIVAIESGDITVARFRGMQEKYNFKQVIDTINIVEKIRCIKTEEELDYIRKACEITDEAYEYIKGYIKSGMTEKEVKNELEYYMKKLGAEDVSFSSVVAFGANSSKPHHVSGDTILKEKDIILIDFGCKVNGYCSDMTRTFFIGGITDKQKEIYDIVLNVQLEAEKNAIKGVNVKHLDNIVRAEFEKHNIVDKYLHSLGHGVGLDIHEIPSLSYRVDYILEKGMIVTIEPGIYLENEFGIRIEDTIIIKDDNPEILFNSSKEIQII